MPGRGRALIRPGFLSARPVEVVVEQTRLFRLAVEAGQVSFHHLPGRGWSLTVGLRRGDEPWNEVRFEHYYSLTTVELLDVVAAHLDREL